ncbi:hypothetical protein VSQ48_07065 [Candidatus Ventrimonas sp. KK005]
MLSVEQLPSRYFVTAASFISKEYFECCPIKYAPPYSDSFIILSVYYKGSISKSQFGGSLYVQESNFYKFSRLCITANKGNRDGMEHKVCQQQNRIAIDLSKKAEPLARIIAPMDMNTHIM